MHGRRDFEIAFVGLKTGVHEYVYTVDDHFFEEWGTQEFRGTKAEVKLHLEKATGFMILRFAVGGQTEVTCDRCSSELPIQLFEDYTVTVKGTDDPEASNDSEEDPDVFYISRTESHLDVKPWVYEFVCLSIPMQKTCDWEEMNGPHCNPEARKMLEQLKPADTEPPRNSIWKGLDDLANLNN